ncbi:hypothetical protein FHY55_19400 [Oceanicola sp. D3]|uniref:hypothetical protein n=1 Tax=Oceanicola sp. D3 TaxID=2587163 RepID=UPI0011240DC1|nr:hypothetical protein [Oceanicola sp. D3]QDC11265.1 hypothetical protein FHY55_19400 [Oceanicola sp. D3]
MDSTEQQAGEKRVRERLVDELEKRGLMRPTGMTKEQYQVMTSDLCAKLAYMAPLSLDALAEVAAGRAGGPQHDRFPVAQVILTAAAEIQAPPIAQSPLMRAVFANDLGRRAMAEGWGPELLGELRRNRRWPNPYAQSEIKKRGLENVAQFNRMLRMQEDGAHLRPSDLEFIEARRAAIARCEELVNIVEGEVAA